jgi:hypothetical protein
MQPAGVECVTQRKYPARKKRQQQCRRVV